MQKHIFQHSINASNKGKELKYHYTLAVYRFYWWMNQIEYFVLAMAQAASLSL